jgi:hypothetical protein
MGLAQLSVKTRYSIRVCNMLTPFGIVDSARPCSVGQGR